MSSSESLLKEIIQHIQSFLDGKEAARTTILSKSWYQTWLIRPTINIDEGHHRFHGRFHKYLTTTMQRYVQSKLNIQSFTLKRIDHCANDNNLFISNAIKIGTIDFTLNLEDSVFPLELLASENLTRLSLKWCKFDGVISSSNLKSLGVEGIRLEDQVFKSVIVSTGYPSLPLELLASENLTRLSLKWCKLDGDHRCPNLKSLELDSIQFEYHWFRDVISSLASIQELSISNCNNSEYDFQVSRLNLNGLHNLKRLSLNVMEIDYNLFCDCTTRFPCLHHLSITGCRDPRTRPYFYKKPLQIVSKSIQYIHLEAGELCGAEFDVPNIREFKFTYYRGHGVFPTRILSIQTVSREWELCISLRCWRLPENPLHFLINLKSLLLKFRNSRLSLSLSYHSGKQFEIDNSIIEVIPLEPPLVLENLNIDAGYFDCSALLPRLFRICSPKFITLLGKKPIDMVNRRHLHEVMFSQFDVYPVHIEFFEKVSTGENQRTARFELKWKRRR